ncbi:MAG: acyltransferase [Cytophagaceae bacterium]|nr:MAG: acyltransferase [Cytophagaceae bacterium]
MTTSLENQLNLRQQLVRKDESKKYTFNYPLEALRGLAAVFVVLHHATLPGSTPDPAYRPTGIWQYSPPGHLSVLIFFILSGYVIGITNQKPILSSNDIKSYLKKRFVRIYPLYILAILASLMIEVLYQEPVHSGDVLGWSLFLQGLVVKVPQYNHPLWSLGYEIVYYIIFLLVSAKQWRVQYVILFSLLLAFLFAKTGVQPTSLVSYAYGAAFWFVGLWLAKLPKSEKPPEYGSMLAFVFLMLCYERLNLITVIARSVNMDTNPTLVKSFFDQPIVFADLSNIVLCIPLLLCFTNRSFPHKAQIQIIPFAIPIVYILIYVVSGKIYKSEIINSLAIPAIIYFLSLLAYIVRNKINKIGEKFINNTVFLGAISYGIYIIHFPIFFLFRQVKYFSGTAESFMVRMILFLSIVYTVAWVLEKRIQPWIKTKLL